MAVTAALRRAFAGLAAGAPLPVFAAVGEGARDRVEELGLRSRVRLAASPRHASILLVAGRIPAGFQPELDRVHDQLPHPRATLYWGADAPRPGLEGGDAEVAGPEAIGAGDDPVPRLAALHRALLREERPSESHWRPNEPPAPWRGRGPHGQGGEGMMGGVPYGRPMAMTDDDIRDALALDRLTLTVGPFFPALPPGLVMRLGLQGDVVQEVEVVAPPFEQPLPAVVDHVLHEAVAGAKPEEARARLLLRRVARVLRVAGAAALADRALAAALSPDLNSAGVVRLETLVRRGGTLAAFPSRPSLPSARGHGRDPDADGGVGLSGAVTWAFDVAERAIRRATRSARDGTRVGPVAAVSDLGPPFDHDPAAAMQRLPELLPGLEWGEALLTIACLELGWGSG